MVLLYSMCALRVRYMCACGEDMAAGRERFNDTALACSRLRLPFLAFDAAVHHYAAGEEQCDRK